MRKNLKSIFNFYINSSLHVAVAVVCLCAVSILNFGHNLSGSLLLFIFLGTITSYNFVKYAGIAKLHHSNLPKGLKSIQLFSLFIFLGLIISTFYQPFEILIIASISGVFTLLYALPVFSRNRNLRALPGLKIYVIGVVVSIVTVLMPLVLNEDLMQRDIVIEFLQRFLLVIALVIPFEIRDLEFDAALLNTIPQKIGLTRSKILGYILIILVISAEFLKQEILPENLWSLIGVGIITILFLNRSQIKQGEYYASFWVEAIPIMWILMLFGLAGVL